MSALSYVNKVKPQLRWHLLLGLLTVPLSYATALLLGRLGAESLGRYALVVASAGIANTFAVYGGPPLVARLVSLNQGQSLGPVMGWYAAVSFLVGIISLPLLWIIYLEKTGILWSDLLVIGLAVLVTNTLLYTLMGKLEVTVAAFIRVLPTVCLFIVGLTTFIGVGVSFIWAYVVTCVLALVIGHRVLKPCEGPVRRPNGIRDLITYGLPIHAAAVFSFLFMEADKFIVAGQLSVTSLGVAMAALQTVQLARLVPTLTNDVMQSMFTAVAVTDRRLLRQIYVKASQLLSHTTIPIALLLAYFAPEVLDLFGPSYSTGVPLVVLLSMSASIGALGGVMASLVLAAGKSVGYLVNSAVLVLIQLSVAWALLDDFGLSAIGFGRIAGTLCGQIGLVFLVRIQMGELVFPRPYWIGLVLTCVSGTVLVLFPLNVVLRIVGFLGCVTVYVATSVTKDDLIELVRLVTGGSKGATSGHR